MKKNQTVQGTFSKIFGKKHASPNTTSLYVTNPPWIFTQEAPEEGARVLGKCARGRGGGPRLGSAVRAAGSRRARGGGEGTRWNLRTGREGAAGKGGGAERASLGRGCGGKRRGRRGPSLPEGGDLCGPRRVPVFLPRCLLSLPAAS